jgi:hypothetical protein
MTNLAKRKIQIQLFLPDEFVFMESTPLSWLNVLDESLMILDEFWMEFLMA